LQKLQDGVKQT